MARGEFAKGVKIYHLRMYLSEARHQRTRYSELSGRNMTFRINEGCEMADSLIGFDTQSKVLQPE